MLPPGDYASTKYISSNTCIARTVRVCVCVCACVRACMRACVRACVRVLLHV